MSILKVIKSEHYNNESSITFSYANLSDMNKYLRYLGKRVRQAREDFSWSQQGLADVLARYGVSVTQATINHIETGNRKPSIEVLLALRLALDLSGDYLLGVSDDQSSPCGRIVSESQLQLERVFGQLSPARQHESIVIEFVTDAIHYIAEQANRDALVAAKTDDTATETLHQIEHMQKRLADIDASRERLVRAYIDLGAISDAEFAEQKHRLAENRQAIDERLAELLERQKANGNIAEYPMRLEDIAQRGLSMLNAPTREANAWLRRHFEILIADYTVEEVRYL